MSNTFLNIAVISIVTFLTRAFPFILFSKNGTSPPKIILYLGKYLPPAIISAILVYSFRDVVLFKFPFGIKEIVSSSIVIFLYLYKKNALVSILVGTFVYMAFTQILQM